MVLGLILLVLKEEMGEWIPMVRFKVYKPSGAGFRV